MSKCFCWDYVGGVGVDVDGVGVAAVDVVAVVNYECSPHPK